MSLDTYVRSFIIQAPVDRIVAGTPINLTAAPTEILDIPTTEILTGPVDLEIVLKHVQLPGEAGVTPFPPSAQATNILANVTSGLTAPVGAGSIEGWLASISGTVPIGTRDISGQIAIDLRWRFTDFNSGAELADVAVTGGALTAAAVTIVVPPVVAEMTTVDFNGELASLGVTRSIGVQLIVRGRIGTTFDTGEVELPGVPLRLDIIPIPLPTVAALFRDQELTGDAVLVMVPRSSPFASAAELMAAVSSLRGVLDTVNDAAIATTWATGTRGLHSAVTSLANRVPLTQHLGFRAREDHNDLGKYNFIVVNNWPDTDIEDRGSSALLVSATRTVSFFEHNDFGGEELAIDAKPSGTDRFGGAVVRRLHVSLPESLPPGCVSSTGSVDGTWGDVISSYRWGAE